MRRTARWTVVGAVVAAAVAMGGCAAAPEAPEPEPEPNAPTAAPAPSRSTPPEEAKRGAEQVAVRALSAFVDHNRPQDAWWADFSQYLAPEALYVWEGVRAARVTASAITGDPITTVVDGTFATVIVPTDVGAYRLDMTRRVSPESAEGVWLVYEMTPPGQSR